MKPHHSDGTNIWDVLSWGAAAWLANRLLSPPCPGPLMEYRVPLREEQIEDGSWVLHTGSIQRCTRCSYIVTSGNYHDDRHRRTPLNDAEAPH